MRPSWKKETEKIFLETHLNLDTDIIVQLPNNYVNGVSISRTSYLN